MSKEKDFFGKKQGSKITGTICIALAIIVFFWAQSHSPENIAGALRSGWILSEGNYYITLVFAVFIGIYGIINLVRSLRSEKKNS